MNDNWFNGLVRWSNLSRFGSGKIAKLTIVAPFIAFIVVFNAPLREFINVGSLQHPSDPLSFLLAKRLEFFYLGLVLVGASVGIFSFFVPPSIALALNFQGFIEAKERIKTHDELSASLEATIDQFMCLAPAEDQSPFYGPSSATYPNIFRANLFRLVEGQFEKILPDIRSEEFPDDCAHYFTGTGHVATDQVLNSLTNRRRVEWNLWRPFYGNLDEVSKDVFRLEYLLADHSLPNLRLSLFAFFVIGSVVLFIPTIATFVFALEMVFLSP